ncbi:MAG TPA: hypothetical protein VJ242_02415 [Patescibacteria group bacterium]|nr:hypothetical protein [Patescibacteria group bacterium]
MKPQEKKYLVSSFTKIENKLARIGAKKVKEVISVHYYGQHSGNDVEKFVEYADRVEAHVLKESGGQFTMIKHEEIPDKNSGLGWLRNQGYKTMNIVKMAYREYSYKNGTVGLYTIDDFLLSVILYYPSGQHEAIEKEFGLERAEVISVPYNKFLDQLGRLRSTNL